LKPDNIWLESNHRGGYNVKVLDFGIAKLADPLDTPPLEVPKLRPATAITDRTLTAEDTPTLALESTTAEDTPTIAFDSTSIESGSRTPTTLKTRVGAVLGTPAYMSPEQCRGDAVDHRADVYSLAVIAYELITGKRPFHSDTLSGLLTQQMEQAPPSPNEHAPVPPMVADAVLRGLQKDPANRPPTAGTFAAQMRVGVEGDFGAMRRAKDLFNSYPAYFIPLLAMSFLPLALTMSALLLVIPHISRAVIPGGPMILWWILPLYVLVALLCVQFVKTANCIALQMALEGGFRPFSRLVAAQMLRRLPALLRTQAISLFDLRPASFRDNLLWPIVYIVEGLSGRAAIQRSRELCRTIPAVAINFVPRQYSPAILISLLFPAMFSLGPGDMLSEMARTVRAGERGGFFWLLWPMIMLMMYSFFGTAFSFLYWLAKWCRGEGAIPAFPISDVRRAQRRGLHLRPGMVFWWLLPVVLVVLVGNGIRKTKYVDYRAAISDGRQNAVLRYIDQGAPIEIVHHGWTPLMWAASYGNKALAEQLLNRGASVKPADTSDTPLILAIDTAHLDIAELLVAHGASLEQTDSGGRTPLMHAVMQGNADMVKLLVARGAKASVKDQTGKTAVDYARQEGRAEIEELVRR
jgi:hypothetical protein